MSDSEFAVLRLNVAAFANSYRGPHSRLIADYSPTLVLFPETERDGPPWQGKATDYHPRCVDIYLSECGLRPPVKQLKASKGWFGPFAVWLLNGALRDLAMLEPPQNVNIKAKVTALFRRRQAELKSDTKQEPILLNYSLDNGVIDSREAWDRYHGSLKSKEEKFPRTCYVTVVPRGTQLAVTYWFFYYFNDYWNKHQADFESVTVFFRSPGTDELIPTGCAYAAHSEGLYRFWPDVSRLTPDDTHPIALVARGSHGFYPAPRFGGHIPAMEIERQFANRMQYRLALSPMQSGRPVEDTVVIRNAQQIGEHPWEEYEIQVVPEISQLTPDNPEVWDKWWWLAYDGLWGSFNRVPLPRVRLGGINGPRRQQDRWTNPWRWVRNCQLDGRTWSDL